MKRLNFAILAVLMILEVFLSPVSCLASGGGEVVSEYADTASGEYAFEYSLTEQEKLLGGELEAHSANIWDFSEAEAEQGDGFRYASVSKAAADNATVDSKLCAGLENLSSSINLIGLGLNSTQLNAAVGRVIWGNPQFFYVDGGYSYRSFAGVCTSISFDYKIAVGDIPAARAVYNQKLNDIVSLVDDSWSDLEKALFVHDYFGTNYEYDLTYTYYDAYNLLTQNIGVCQSYALAYMAVLRLLNIRVDYVVSDSMNHIWNSVYINGGWYHVDATWDDATPDLLGRVSHDHFLCTDAEMTANGYSDWTSSKTISATTFEGQFWEEISSPFVYLDGKWYYADAFELCRYDYTTASAEKLNISLGRWFVWNSSSYWVSVFSGIIAYDGYIYYNTAFAIRRYDPVTGNNKAILEPNTSNGYVYGIRMRDNGYIDYVMAQSYSLGNNVTVSRLEVDNNIYAMSGSASVRGTGAYGSAVYASVDLISPASATYSIQWLRNGEPISGATGESYVIKERDIGSSISFVVIGTGNYSGVFESAYVIADKAERELGVDFAINIGEVTDSRIIVESTLECEYSVDGINWQQSNIIEGLSRNTEYTVFKRYASTATYFESVAVTATVRTLKTVISGTVIIEGTPEYGQLISAVADIQEGATVEYRWLSGSGIIAEGQNLQLTQEHIYMMLTVSVTGTGDYEGVLESGFIVVEKAFQSPPGAPTLKAYTLTSIELNAVEGCEYGIAPEEGAGCNDTIDWTSNPLFEGLTENTVYSIYMRKAETGVLAPSRSSFAFMSTDSEKLALAAESPYEIDEYLVGVEKLTSANEILTSFAQGEVTVCDAAGTELSGEAKVGTGSVIKLYKDGKLSDEIVVCVGGDTNGDAMIGTSDYILVKLQNKFGEALNGVYLTAADLDGSGSVTSADFIQLKMLCLSAY